MLPTDLRDCLPGFGQPQDADDLLFVVATLAHLVPILPILPIALMLSRKSRTFSGYHSGGHVKERKAIPCCSHNDASSRKASSSRSSFVSRETTTSTSVSRQACISSESHTPLRGRAIILSL